MAMSSFHLQPIQQETESFTSFFFPIDSHFNTSCYQRGPRYEAYACLRESRLRAKRTKPPNQFQKTPGKKHREEEDLRSILSPKKEVKFERSLPKRAKGSSILAQSVPDFAAVVRKENRKPQSVAGTPPSGLKKGGGRGSKSVNSGGEKRAAGAFMARKSCASIQEFKGLASIARAAINGETRVGVTTRASSRNVLRTSNNF